MQEAPRARPPQRRPRSSPGRPETHPRFFLGPSWVNQCKLYGLMLSAKIDSKPPSKRAPRMNNFLNPSVPVLHRSWARLGFFCNEFVNICVFEIITTLAKANQNRSEQIAKSAVTECHGAFWQKHCWGPGAHWVEKYGSEKNYVLFVWSLNILDCFR